MASFTLGKDERLKSRKAIGQLFNTGQKFSLESFLIYYLVTDEVRKQPLQFGVGVGSKQFKKAVDRNRIKRLTREAYRLQKATLQELIKQEKKSLNLFFIYTGKEMPAYNAVHATVGKAMTRISSLLDKSQ